MEQHGPKHLAKLRGKGYGPKDAKPEITDEADSDSEE